MRFAKFYEIWNLKLLNFIEFYLRSSRLLARRKAMRAAVRAIYRSRAAQDASVRHTLRRSKRTAGDIKSAGSLRAHYNKTLTHSQARYAMPNLRRNHRRDTRCDHVAVVIQPRLNRIVSQGIATLLSPYAVRFCGSSLRSYRAAPLGGLGRELRLNLRRRAIANTEALGMQGATADAQFSALNATSATERAKLRKRKAKFKPVLLHQLVIRRKAIQTKGVNLNLAPQPLARCAVTNSRRQSTARILTRRAILDRVIAAKFKELLNFKVRRILRILKFTALKFHSLR